MFICSISNLCDLVPVISYQVLKGKCLKLSLKFKYNLYQIQQVFSEYLSWEDFQVVPQNWRKLVEVDTENVELYLM